MRMFFVKDLARKVLHKEIAEIKNELNNSKEKNIELKEEVEMLRSGSKALRNDFDKIELEKTKVQRELDDSQKENEILRKYYDLDKEPSDEIKLRIHIDLEVNRLKNENLKLIANGRPVIVQQPYPIYTPRFGRMFY